MKDPLQTELTPYELLGLERGATASDIDRAFKTALVKRANVQKLTAAKLALQRPLERGMLDLFQYDPKVLPRLAPSPVADPSVLAPEKRAATAKAWESLLRKTFPDAGLAHSLAVLWYWWAADATDAATRGGTRSAPSANGGPAVDERWRQAIGYWAMLAANDDFWKAAGWIDADIGRALQEATIERLKTQLRNLVQHPAGSVCRGLELALTTELRTAQELAAAGLRTKYGKVSCGSLVLHHFGMLDSTRAQIEAQIRKSGSASRMRALRDMLSPYGPIRALLDAKKPAEALVAINVLPRSQRDLREVVALRARALHERGRQQASVEQFEEALQSWAEALPSAAQADLEQELRTDIVQTCRTRAAALSRRREEAIAILEKGLALVREESLDHALAELLTQRGVEIIVGTQKEIQEKKRVTDELLSVLTRGLADLERASELGGERAREQAQIARDYIAQAKGGMLDIPEAAAEELRQVTEAAGRQDWDAAVAAQRKALKVLGRKAPPALKQNLATLLNNRAMQNANRAGQMLDSAVQAFNSLLVEFRMANMRQRRDARLHGTLALVGYDQSCDHCSTSWSPQWFTLSPAGELPFTVCGKCADELRQRMAPPPPDRDALVLLASAETDLTEAVKLDATDVIKKNLNDVRELRVKLGANTKAIARAAKGPNAFARFAAGARAALPAIVRDNWIWIAMAIFAAISQCQK